MKMISHLRRRIKAQTSNDCFSKSMYPPWAEFQSGPIPLTLLFLGQVRRTRWTRNANHFIPASIGTVPHRFSSVRRGKLRPRAGMNQTYFGIRTDCVTSRRNGGEVNARIAPEH